MTISIYNCTVRYSIVLTFWRRQVKLAYLKKQVFFTTEVQQAAASAVSRQEQGPINAQEK
ncbi:hypothetical protein ACIPF8_00900 [Collimonas sp. NPDC087041]|uniref:hypothetical protein n=1 Tax=Collimonas sp. NPDC087041 TaxID=3363960 RepID=UPI00380597DE